MTVVRRFAEKNNHSFQQMKKVKRIRQRQRRQIEDVPFYKFKYKFDELPLDPARPFILEQISIDLCQDFQALYLINKNSLFPRQNQTIKIG